MNISIISIGEFGIQHQTKGITIFALSQHFRKHNRGLHENSLKERTKQNTNLVLKFSNFVHYKCVLCL